MPIAKNQGPLAFYSTQQIRELFTRLPDIEAAGPPELLLSSFIHGVKHLPATFTPGGA